MFPKLLIALAIGITTTTLHAADTRTDIRIATPWEISGSDPATDGFIFLRMGVMETLVSTDANGTLQPGLALSWQAADDGLSWRFTLRKATFHDGSVLSSGDVAEALTRAAANPGPLNDAPISQISADGDDVIVTLESPYGILPAVLTHSSTVIPASSSADETGESLNLIGTGPFKVDSLSVPQSMTTSRYEDYWGEPAKLSGASYLAVKRAETRALMAESGDADMVHTLDPSGYRRLSDVDSVQVQSVAIPRVMLLKMNAAHPLLDTPTARRALSLTIDREGIAAGIMRAPESAATQLFPPALQQWHDKTLPALQYSPEKASEMLASLGWTPGEDGILVREGERFSLTLRTFPDRPELPLVGAALQDQWRQIGVELQVSVSNFSEIPAGHQDGTLAVALYARNYASTVDPTGAVQSDFGVGGGDWGAMNWQAPEVAEAVSAIAASAESDERHELIRQVITQIHEDLPVAPVVWYQHTVATAKGLQGVVVDPLERTYGLQALSWSE